MNHPDELLAGYVDGTLRGGDLETVRAHLSQCRRCREEVALATAAARALATTPAPTPPSPPGDAAIREARRRAGSPAPARGQQPTWYRWAAAAAAAAAVVVVLALLLPDVGQGPSGASSATRAAGSADLGGPLTLEVQRTNYDPATLQALGVAEGDVQTGGSSAAIAPQAEATAGLATGSPSPAGTSKALACIRKAWPTIAGRQPVRLIAARFEGKPAYLAVYLHGPGAGEPPDLLTITVTYAGTCTFGPTFAHRLG
jgi:hypothetical protein